MFRGQFSHTVDLKGRTSIPAKFREILAASFDERLILANHFDGCLWGCPVAEWQALETKVASLSKVDAQVNAFRRVVISSAVECSIDKLGRILIPPTLRDYAGLSKDLIFVGVTDKIEIWAKDRWEEVLKKDQQLLAGNNLSALGL